ncbi:MAG: SWIM zinc finger domain-containing protein [Rhodobacter sp.]|nr:SWIM zinc finger domain-containing protein [Rhodobacter sp.]
MANIEHAYRYPGHSSLSGTPGKQQLSLVCDTADPRESRDFLTAVALSPDISAKALRAVSEIVGSRFYVPPSMLARILREADPVATVSPEAVRFEGFSACCSAYIRLDMDDGALEVSHRRSGTTNVDFGAELRAALAQVQPGSRMEINIGPQSVGISHERAAVVERKVPLPARWIRGFGNVQVHLAGMEPAFTLSQVAAQRFLRSLPRSKSDHQIWVAAAQNIVRTTSRRTPGGVPLRGAHRLRVFETLVGKAKALQVFKNPDLESSAWVLDFGTQRLILVLNAEPWRGFSGDGGLLSELALADVDTAALRAQLNWQDRLDIAALTQATAMTPDQVRRAIAHLAASGLVGFDLAQGAWFHRVLPLDMTKLDALNPRLKAARKLVDAGAVALCDDGAEVTSKDAVHRVRLDEAGYSCTCAWYARNKAARGPCKHVLATEIAEAGGS